MRLWSLHPKYLDTKGIVALWREALLAKHVLEGKTKGYTNHPQLNRFKKAKNPLHAINQYLSVVHEEATARGYNFNIAKVDQNYSKTRMKLHTGQLQYEWQHLLKKLKVRDENRYKNQKKLKMPEVIPMFRLVEGGVEDWEIV